MDELYGRLKASRERVQELEKEIQNSTSNVQKREMVFILSFSLISQETSMFCLSGSKRIRQRK